MKNEALGTSTKLKQTASAAESNFTKVKKIAFQILKAMEANATGLDPEVALIADKWIADLAGRVASGTLSSDYHAYAQTVVTKYLNAHPRQKWSAFTATTVSTYCGKQKWSADHTATVMGRLKHSCSSQLISIMFQNSGYTNFTTLCSRFNDASCV